MNFKLSNSDKVLLFILAAAQVILWSYFFMAEPGADCPTCLTTGQIYARWGAVLLLSVAAIYAGVRASAPVKFDEEV